MLTFIAVVGFSMLLGFYVGRIVERRTARQRIFQMRQNRNPTFQNEGGPNQRRNLDPTQRPTR